MATDATGTPTSQGIPKYDTAVDAPSGRGFNAAMDAIDTLITSALKTIVKKAGTIVGTRRGLNFIEGSNVTITVADDAANDEVDVTIAATVPASTIAVKESGTTAGTRGGINFIEGTNISLTLADDAGNNEVDVTVTNTGPGMGLVIALGG